MKPNLPIVKTLNVCMLLESQKRNLELSVHKVHNTDSLRSSLPSDYGFTIINGNVPHKKSWKNLESHAANLNKLFFLRSRPILISKYISPKKVINNFIPLFLPLFLQRWLVSNKQRSNAQTLWKLATIQTRCNVTCTTDVWEVRLRKGSARTDFSSTTQTPATNAATHPSMSTVLTELNSVSIADLFHLKPTFSRCCPYRVLQQSAKFVCR